MRNPRGPDIASRLKRRADDPVLKPFMFLFAAHRPEMWWYEVVETVRRLTMTGLPRAVSATIEIRLAVGCLLSFVSILLHTDHESRFRTRRPIRWHSSVTCSCLHGGVRGPTNLGRGGGRPTDFWAGIPLGHAAARATEFSWCTVIMTQAQRDQHRRSVTTSRARCAGRGDGRHREPTEGPSYRGPDRTKRGTSIAPRDAGSKDPDIRVVPCAASAVAEHVHERRQLREVRLPVLRHEPDQPVRPGQAPSARGRQGSRASGDSELRPRTHPTETKTSDS